MFATVAAGLALASAAMMPPIIDNELYGPNKDWAPLMAEYANCQEVHGHSYFMYTVCTMEWKHKAQTNSMTKDA